MLTPVVLDMVHSTGRGGVLRPLSSGSRISGPSEFFTCNKVTDKESVVKAEEKKGKTEKNRMIDNLNIFHNVI